MKWCPGRCRPPRGGHSAPWAGGRFPRPAPVRAIFHAAPTGRPAGASTSWRGRSCRAAGTWGSRARLEGARRGIGQSWAGKNFQYEAVAIEASTLIGASNATVRRKMQVADLRGILQYVPRFRDRIFVIAIDGEIIESENFSNLLLDLAVLRSLNIRVVLVHGARHQIERRAVEEGLALSNTDG